MQTESIQLPVSGPYDVLGKPVMLESDLSALHAYMMQSFRLFDRAECRAPGPELRIRMDRLNQMSDARADHSLHFTVEECSLVADASGLRFRADRETGRAIGVMSVPYLSDPAWVRRNVLECMALFLATGVDRTALHAAALVRGNICVLLAGPSGAGKSTLSYALLHHGFDVLAEEAVYISENPVPRLYGHPASISLCPDCRETFPDLAHSEPVMLPNGKRKIRVDLTRTPFRQRCRFDFSGRIVVCFLSRGSKNRSEILEITRDDMNGRLLMHRESGFDLSTAFPGVIRRLSIEKAYELSNGGTVHETAMRLMETLKNLDKEPDRT